MTLNIKSFSFHIDNTNLLEFLMDTGADPKDCFRKNAPPPTGFKSYIS